MILIIHNPLSNNRKSKKSTLKVVKFCQKNQLPYLIRSTLKIDNLNQFLDNNPQITDIIYLGGDGSFNYLVNHVDLALIKQNIYLAQSGSGNDFCRTLKRIKQGSIAIGLANNNTQPVRFINGCGLGVDAAVCHYVNADSKKNKLSYFVNTFKAISQFKPTTMDVTVDGVAHHFPKTFFVAIQNGRYFGGGMKVAPKANPESDDYQVIVAHSISKALISLLFVTIYPGLHTHLKKFVTMLQGKSIKISSDEPNYFQTDGEVIDNVSYVEVSKVLNREFIAYNPKTMKLNQNG